MKISNGADLDKLYHHAEGADKSDFATWRSQLALIAGDHYNKKGNNSWDRVRNFRNFEKSMKLRLTKNHFGKIAKRYSNNLCSLSPNVKPMPKHEREMQDQKSAELYDAIWQDGQEINNFESKKMDSIDDFMWIGETYLKLYFDPMAGARIGYNQAMDPQTGEPLFEQVKQMGRDVDPETGEVIQVEQIVQGEPIADPNSPVHEGQILMERVYAFNVLMDPNSDGLEDSPWVCIRKTVEIEKLKAMFPDKADHIAQSSEKPFLVFHIDHGYRQSDSKKETLVKEWYIRPNEKHPNGYWYIHINGHILDEGELPITESGQVIFPIVGEYAEKIQTKRRGISPLQPLRSLQSECNRTFSKIAEHQISLGDDKLLIQHGTKVSSGTKLPGLRAVTYTGQAPQILAGRTGSQYLEYANHVIQEMYNMADLDEADPTAQLDPTVLLYRSASQKRKFNRYIKRYELFLKKVCETYINLAKVYFSDDRYIRAVGRHEAVNMAEFKRVEPQHVQITVEASSDDIETKMGKMLEFNTILQYVGGQLGPEQIGKILRNAPYANNEDIFSDMTIDDENAMNDMLMLDRGELPTVQQSDNHEYLIKRASNRMRQPDFQMLDQEVQENYQLYIQGHSQVLEQQQAAIQRAQSGFIPDTGTVVKADLYVRDETNPEDKASRAEFPVDALDWLYQKLQDQQGYKQRMSELPPEVQAMGGQDVPQQ